MMTVSILQSNNSRSSSQTTSEVGSSLQMIDRSCGSIVIATSIVLSNSMATSISRSLLIFKVQSATPQVAPNLIHARNASQQLMRGQAMSHSSRIACRQLFAWELILQSRDRVPHAVGGCASCNTRNQASNCSLNKSRRLIGEPICHVQQRHGRRDPAAQGDDPTSPPSIEELFHGPPSVSKEDQEGSTPMKVGKGQVAYHSQRRTLSWRQGHDWSLEVPRNVDLNTQEGRNQALVVLGNIMGQIAQRDTAFEPQQGMVRIRSNPSFEEVTPSKS